MFNLFDDVPLFTASAALGLQAARCPEMTVSLLRSEAALFLQILHQGRQAQNEIKEKCVLYHQGEITLLAVLYAKGYTLYREPVNGPTNISDR